MKAKKKPRSNRVASDAGLATADKETVRYAEYILNHYDRNSHADHLVLARNLEAWENKRNQVANAIVGSADWLERLVVGNYTITRLDNGNYWVGHQSGEGMETRRELFEDFIHTLYVQEF